MLVALVIVLLIMTLDCGILFLSDFSHHFSPTLLSVKWLAVSVLHFN